MKYKEKQLGSIHLIITIIVVISIIGVICTVIIGKYIFNKSSVNSSMQSTKQIKNTNPDGSVIDDIFNTRLALDYPKSWKVTNHAQTLGSKYKGLTIGDNTYIFQSPDNNFEIQFTIFSGPFSTSYCDSQRDMLDLETYDITKYPNAKLVIVGYFEDNNAVSYYAGIMNNNNETSKINKTDSECKIDLNSTIKINDNIEVLLRIKYNYQDSNSNQTSSVDEYDKFIKAKELNSFKEAKQIVQSLHLEN